MSHDVAKGISPSRVTTSSPEEGSRAHEVTKHPTAAPSMCWSLRLATIVIVVAILASAGWRLAGGSEYVITSPSMCPAVCVGSLVLDEPAGQHVHAGEIVSFVPPGMAQVYTHRVLYVFANGSFETKGDAANIVDPWRVYPSMLRGHAVVTLRGAGWLDLALPFLALALTLILVARRALPLRNRREWERLFVSVMVVVPMWLLKPLVRGIIVEVASPRPGVSQITVVNTGLLPAQFGVPKGQVVSFVGSGQRTTLTGVVKEGHQLGLTQVASFHWWGWTIVGVVVSSPLIWYVVHLLRPSSRAERELVLRGRHLHVPPPAMIPDVTSFLVDHETGSPSSDDALTTPHSC